MDNETLRQLAQLHDDNVRLRESLRAMTQSRDNERADRLRAQSALDTAREKLAAMTSRAARLSTKLRDMREKVLRVVKHHEEIKERVDALEAKVKRKKHTPRDTNDIWKSSVTGEDFDIDTFLKHVLGDDFKA